MEAELSGLLRCQVKEEWLASAQAHLGSRYNQVNETQRLKLLLQQLLHADFNLCGLARLPADVQVRAVESADEGCRRSQAARVPASPPPPRPPPPQAMHNTTLHGKLVLQLDEVTNIGAAVRERYSGRDGDRRTLKLLLTDGGCCRTACKRLGCPTPHSPGWLHVALTLWPCRLHPPTLRAAGCTQVVGLEYQRIPALQSAMPAGAKLAVAEVPVRRGILLLTPNNCWVLGGGVERLDAARQRVVQHWNQPAVGRRGPPPTIHQFRAAAGVAAWQEGEGAAAAATLRLPLPQQQQRPGPSQLTTQRLATQGTAQQQQRRQQQPGASQLTTQRLTVQGTTQQQQQPQLQPLSMNSLQPGPGLAAAAPPVPGPQRVPQPVPALAALRRRPLLAEGGEGPAGPNGPGQGQGGMPPPLTRQQQPQSGGPQGHPGFVTASALHQPQQWQQQQQLPSLQPRVQAQQQHSGRSTSFGDSAAAQGRGAPHHQQQQQLQQAQSFSFGGGHAQQQGGSPPSPEEPAGSISLGGGGIARDQPLQELQTNHGGGGGKPSVGTHK